MVIYYIYACGASQLNVNANVFPRMNYVCDKVRAGKKVVTVLTQPNVNGHTKMW